MYYIDVSNCISINLSTPWYHVPSTASSVPSAVAVVGDGSFTDGWMTVSPMWMTLTARPGSRKRPNGTTRFNTSASYESLWNWGPSTSATSIFNAMTVILWYILIYTVIQIRSYCFLADSRRLWLCLFRLGLRTGTSRANNAYIASKNQSYFCSLHVQICARFTYFLQDILQGQCSAIYLKQIWLWLARALWPWVCGFLCRSLGTVTMR